MPNTYRKNRKLWLQRLFEFQQARANTKLIPLSELICEAELRKTLDEPLEGYMQGACKGQLILEHIDNNRSNNDLGNLQILCRSMNVRKNPPKLNGKSVKSARHNKIKLSAAKKNGLGLNVQLAKSARHNKIKHSPERERRNEQANETRWQNGGEPAIVRYKEMEKNLVCEPVAKRFIDKVMKGKREVEYKEMVDSIALASDCSQQTASRYLDKRCAPIGGKYQIDYVDGKKLIRHRTKTSAIGSGISAEMI